MPSTKCDADAQCPQCAASLQGFSTGDYEQRRIETFCIRYLMSHHLLRICAVDRSSHSLSNDYQYLTQSHQRSLSSRVGRYRLRTAPASPLRSRRRARGTHSLQNLHQKLSVLASQQQAQQARRRPSTTDRSFVSESITAARATAATPAAPPGHLSRALTNQEETMEQTRSRTQRSCVDRAGADATSPPPPPHRDVCSSGRQSRATSTASRPNRLSLTLPISLANADMARITHSPVAPGSAVTSSIPPTPLETSDAGAPNTASDFIIAIAAQERRVFELKEELVRAETELAKLKKQWSAQEFYRKRSDSQRTEAFRAAAGAADDDVFTAKRRSIELDRRKLLLQTQQGATTPSTRRVLRGSHARTLSLLSPVKTDGSIPSTDDSRTEAILLPSMEQKAARDADANANANSHVTKRSSWQPRSQPPPSSSAGGIPQIIEDFKYGFQAFVEDIRQIAIGDEPVYGAATTTASQRPPATSFPDQRRSLVNKDQPGEAASSSPTRSSVRPKPTSTSQGSSNGAGRESTAASQLSRTPEPKPRAGKAKHFSWTPLGVDSFDDTDWTNWDSPESNKSARWSGSTLNGHGLDEVQSVAGKGDEAVFEGARKPAAGADLLLSPPFEATFSNVAERPSPSSLNKRTTTCNPLDEWEKSLTPPDDQAKMDCV